MLAAASGARAAAPRILIVRRMLDTRIHRTKRPNPTYDRPPVGDQKPSRAHAVAATIEISPATALSQPHQRGKMPARSVAAPTATNSPATRRLENTSTTTETW